MQYWNELIYMGKGFAAHLTNLVLYLLSPQMNKQFWRKPSVFAICYQSVSWVFHAWAQHQEMYNTMREAYAAQRRYLQTASRCSHSLYFQMKLHERMQY